MLPVLAAVQGLFWSGLLSASSAYMTDGLPESRRAEGFADWGLATVGAIAILLASNEGRNRGRS